MGQMVQKFAGIKGWIEGAVLSMALMFCTPIAIASNTTATEYDGEQVVRLIKKRLASEGLDGNPSIDADRKFKACHAMLRIDPMFGGWNTVNVRCDDAAGWRLAIRTNLSSRPIPVPIRDFRPGWDNLNRFESKNTPSSLGLKAIDEINVVALSGSVSRNDMIALDDLVMIPVPKRNAAGAFFDPADVAGRRMKVKLSANQPLLARHLQPNYLVEEGNEVLITTSSSGISVDMVGFALENGQIGEWIGVENANSGKTIRAKVTGEKKVRVIAKK